MSAISSLRTAHRVFQSVPVRLFSSSTDEKIKGLFKLDGPKVNSLADLKIIDKNPNFLNSTSKQEREYALDKMADFHEMMKAKCNSTDNIVTSLGICAFFADLAWCSTLGSGALDWAAFGTTTGAIGTYAAYKYACYEERGKAYSQ